MDTLYDVMPIILYILLSILIIVLIILMIKAMITLNKVDKFVDDVNGKVKKLNGVFSLLDTATDTLSFMGDKIVDFLATKITKIFTKKKKENIEEENEDEQE